MSCIFTTHIKTPATQKLQCLHTLELYNNVSCVLLIKTTGDKTAGCDGPVHADHQAPTVRQT